MATITANPGSLNIIDNGVDFPNVPVAKPVDWVTHKIENEWKNSLEQMEKELKTEKNDHTVVSLSLGGAALIVLAGLVASVAAGIFLSPFAFIATPIFFLAAVTIGLVGVCEGDTSSNKIDLLNKQIAHQKALIDKQDALRTLRDCQLLKELGVTTIGKTKHKELMKTDFYTYASVIPVLTLIERASKEKKETDQLSDELQKQLDISLNRFYFNRVSPN